MGCSEWFLNGSCWLLVGGWLSVTGRVGYWLMLRGYIMAGKAYWLLVDC